ncbi:MAG: hypothetical protein OXC37_04485 [Bdellovibrionaceae bacterium]|nr:hypothetical protein [Pseudobdellovibrionaceae bacterium]
MSHFIKHLNISFYKYGVFSLLFISCFIAPLKSFSHQGHHSEKEIETALSVFEKAILMSPELLEQTENNSVTPFYKFNGHKVYLNESFWNLTKAWLRIYITEIEKYCPCDLDPEFMIETTRGHIPKNLFQKTMSKTKHISKDLSNTGSRITAKYGYFYATVKVSSEIAETILSVFMGLKGAHFLCNAIDIMIIPLIRHFQKYIRTFSYGRNLSNISLIHALKVLWVSRQVKKSQNRVFFIIEEALDFNEINLRKVNQEGPKDHRKLWLNKLKDKTDPLFNKISELKSELEVLEINTTDPYELEQKKEIIENKIEKLQTKINKVSKVNRKSFFGNRFKRYLLLLSRKGQTTYMAGHHLPDKITGKKTLWPLSLQENILEQTLNYKNQSHTLETEPDEIQKALVKEFILKRQAKLKLYIDEKTNQDTTVEERYQEIPFNEKAQVVYSLLESIERIFDTKKDKRERLLMAQSIENVLAVLFVEYFNISVKILKDKYNLSFKELLKLNWNFGRFSHSVYEFSDFLSSISVVTDINKIKFYKYESMEKLLAFLDYLYEVQFLLKDNQTTKQEVLSKLQGKREDLMSLSLFKEKKIGFSLVPFKRAKVKCMELVVKR